jgi:hypothetical protein
MKYKLTTTRTYVTEMIVVAESESDAWTGLTRTAT